MSSASFDDTARRLAAAASSDGAVITQDMTGTITSWNRVAEQIFGHSSTEAVGQSIRLIIPSELQDEDDEIQRRLRTGESLDRYETVRVRKDGQRIGAVKIVRAITECKRLERDARRLDASVESTGDAILGRNRNGPITTAIRRQEILLDAGALQSAIFNSANFSSIATDAKGVIQIFNVGAERMLGYTAADVMNKITPADISDPQELIARATALSLEFGAPIAPGFEALVFKASRGIEDIYELTHIRKDGSRFPAVVSVTALRDVQDTIIGYLLIGTDNTTRKQTEEALRLAAIVDSTDDGIISKDLDGIVTSWNRAAERMFGPIRA